MASIEPPFSLPPPCLPSSVWIIRSVTGVEMAWDPRVQEWKPYVGITPPPHQVLPVRRLPVEIPTPPTSRRRPRIPLSVKERVKERDKWRCVWCHAVEGLTMDHKIPYCDGGSSKAHNLQTLCNQCNAEKGDGPNKVTEAALKRREFNDELARQPVIKDAHEQYAVTTLRLSVEFGR